MLCLNFNSVEPVWDLNDQGNCLDVNPNLTKDVLVFKVIASSFHDCNSGDNRKEHDPQEDLGVKFEYS